MSHLLRRVALVALVALGSTVPAFARSVTVAWDANTESDLAGYVVHYGTAPGTYTASVDVGNRTDFALNLDELTTYYVAVDAYNATGEHSPLSSEVVVGPDYSVCDFSLNTTNTSVGAPASSLTVGLTTQSVCPWSASSFSNWITVSGRTATRGAATVSLSIAANSTGTSRVGTVVIGGRLLLVRLTAIWNTSLFAVATSTVWAFPAKALRCRAADPRVQLLTPPRCAMLRRQN